MSEDGEVVGCFFGGCFFGGMVDDLEASQEKQEEACNVSVWESLVPKSRKKRCVGVKVAGERVEVLYTPAADLVNE